LNARNQIEGRGDPENESKEEQGHAGPEYFACR
jgi:hypothetical protein